MKKILSTTILLMIATIASAQDVIVKKDGSTILSKIIKVGETEVEYKKFKNQQGPTYTISTSNIQAINYENGDKDTFESSNNHKYSWHKAAIKVTTATFHTTEDKIAAVAQRAIIGHFQSFLTRFNNEERILLTSVVFEKAIPKVIAKVVNRNKLVE